MFQYSMLRPSQLTAFGRPVSRSERPAADLIAASHACGGLKSTQRIELGARNINTLQPNCGGTSPGLHG